MKVQNHLMQRPLWALVVATLVLAGCSDESLIAPEIGTNGTAALQSAKPALIDVGGTWSWSRTEHLTFPAWVAVGIFGIEPEGPTTTARCEGSGRMSLVQTGATFTGQILATANECVTRGGTVFANPPVFTPDDIKDGKVHGNSISMLIDDQEVACIYRAVATDTDGNQAIALKGGGACIVPGQPKSQVPLDPPPGGTSTTLSFTAVR